MPFSPEGVQLKGANPSSYPARKLAVGSLIVLYAIIAISKILILIMNEPLIGKNSKLEKSASSFLTSIKYLFWFNMLFNQWYFSWLLKTQKEEVRQFNLRNVLKEWLFYFFVADVIILGVSPFLLGFPSDTTRKQVILVIFAIIPCGLAYFYLINSYHIFGYNPNAHCKNYVLDSAYLEFEGTPKMWKIKETGAFRIVLENAGTIPISEGEVFTIERLVEWKNEIQHINTGRWMSDGRLAKRFSSFVKFIIKLEEEVPVGDHLVLIPAGHTEPGAVQIKKYRSFGNVKGVTTTTSIFDEQKKLLAKFTQKYKEPELGDV